MKKTSKICYSALATSIAFCAASFLGGCEKSRNDSPFPIIEYNQGQDEKARTSAISYLNTEGDLPARLFIAQFYLSRYMRDGNKLNIKEIKEYYRGIDSVKDLSRSNKLYSQLVWLGKYLDAAILFYGDKQHEQAKKLLDSYCPFANLDEKIDCHLEHTDYFYKMSETSPSRDNFEKAFLQVSVVGDAYHSDEAAGRALWLLANYDVEFADRRARQYADRNPWNDHVMTEYCRALDKYRNSNLEDEKVYAAMYMRSDCQEYAAIPPKALESVTH